MTRKGIFLPKTEIIADQVFGTQMNAGLYQAVNRKRTQHCFFYNRMTALNRRSKFKTKTSPQAIRKARYPQHSNEAAKRNAHGKQDALQNSLFHGVGNLAGSMGSAKLPVSREFEVETGPIGTASPATSFQ
jgi:hypothetical protein